MKKYIWITLTSFLIYLALTPLRRHGYDQAMTIGFPLDAIIGSILYFLMTVVCLKKFNDKTPHQRSYILLSILLGCSFVSLPIHVFWFKDSMFTLPGLLLFYCGVLFGAAFYGFNKIGWKFLIAVLFLLTLVLMIVFGYPEWMKMVMVQK